jgi:hypothetical protein
MMFFVFFLGYAQGLTMVFGAGIQGYASMGPSMMTLFRALIGDFDVEAMTKVDKVVGPVLFIMFIMIGMLFLLNVFIAVLSEAYDKAKIQVFGDAFDERDKRWEGAPTFVDYFQETYARLADRTRTLLKWNRKKKSVVLSPHIIVRLKMWARAAVRRVETGDRMLNKETKAFSITEHVKNIEHWLTADDQRMQKHLGEMTELLKRVDSRVSALGQATQPLPPLDLKNRLGEVP